ncbi:hypothetical protein [Ekhidna sp.]|jgi:hypothetical protein|uniref:hypothetical protein n=1 Tax=Ekhidna sp. TaxID=2608089 RepID=UPI0032EF461A
MDNNKQKYIQDAMPQKWFEYANELFKSAELIWASSNRLNHISGTIKFCSDTSNTYFLLMGFSLENLLKGVMICENPELLNEGMLSNKLKGNHQLLDYTKQIETISFSREEEDLLQILGEALPNWGRYPIPTKHKRGFKKRTKADQYHREIFIRLFRKLSISMYDLSCSGIEAPEGVSLHGWSNSEIDLMKKT